MPPRCRTPATYRFLGLYRLLPLPCTNRTIPAASGGSIRSHSLCRCWLLTNPLARLHMPNTSGNSRGPTFKNLHCRKQPSDVQFGWSSGEARLVL
jgi:hypothetical protein